MRSLTRDTPSSVCCEQEGHWRHWRFSTCICIYSVLHLKGISPAPSLHLVEKEGGEGRVYVWWVLLNLSKHLAEFRPQPFAVFSGVLDLPTPAAG